MSNLRGTLKQTTRNLLLRAGLEAFESKGYATATIDDIATGAGANRATFYRHFSSKAQLMRALIAEISEMLVATDTPSLTSVIESGDPEQIRTWLTRKANQWAEIRPYHLSARAAAAADPDMDPVVAEWFEGVIDTIHRGLDLADRFHPASRHIRAVLAFGQLEFLSHRWMRKGWDMDRDLSLDVLTDTWCRLLTDEEPGQDRLPALANVGINHPYGDQPS